MYFFCLQIWNAFRNAFCIFIAKISRLPYVFFLSSNFSVTWQQVVKLASGHISSHLSHQVNRGQFLKSPKIRGPGGAIYLPLLVLNHTAWSTPKGMSTF